MRLSKSKEIKYLSAQSNRESEDCLRDISLVFCISWSRRQLTVCRAIYTNFESKLNKIRDIDKFNLYDLRRYVWLQSLCIYYKWTNKNPLIWSLSCIWRKINWLESQASWLIWLLLMNLNDFDFKKDPRRVNLNQKECLTPLGSKQHELWLCLLSFFREIKLLKLNIHNTLEVNEFSSPEKLAWE